MIGWIKYLWGWEWSVYVHLYGYGWRTFVSSRVSVLADRDSRWVLSPRYFFEDILSLVLPLLTMVLQNRFADTEPLSDPPNEALFEILNPEDVFAILPTSTGHGRSIIFHCLPDLCRELF